MPCGLPPAAVPKQESDLVYDHYQKLLIDKKDRILTVTINNPPLNELVEQLDAELAEIFFEINRDPEVSVVILTAAGDRAFCAGGSFDAMIARRRDHHYENWISGMRRGRRILMSMLDLDQPIIARVQGHAIGLGATLAVYSDITIAAEHVKIADPHVQVGLTAGDGGSLMWPHLMGLARAKYYLLTGDRMTASEAAAFGLIHKAVPASELDSTVNALAARLAGLPRTALRTTKRAVNIPVLRDLVTSMDANFGLETLSMLHADHLEAVTAIKEKRPPKFRGD
ncbi:MAG TPA: enoyl-CoA hydratase-related protein [Steroidobacteraceae bacterium]|nr:enoyl-CoA hydratase-related protein [Steroidobacteraceae bacterium]